MTRTYPSITINFGDGSFVNFSRQQIINASVVEEVNLTSVELPISTLEFSVNDTNGVLNMFDGVLFTKLKEKLPIAVYEYVDEVSKFIGTYYLNTWKNLTPNKVEFTAIDIIGVLADTDFDGIFWDTPVTLSAAMNQIFAPLGIAYELESGVESRTISGWIPPSTYRDALHQICFAARCIVRTARSNKLVIETVRIPVAHRDYVITRSDAKQNAIEVIPPVARIEIVSHNYSASGVLETIFDKELGIGEHKVIFEKPYYGIVINGAGYVEAALGTESGDYIGTEGEDYIEAGGEFTLGSNSVYFYMTEPGQVTITGYQWLDSKRSYVFNEANTENTKNKKNYLISDATLVNADRAQDVLDGLRDFYRLRYLQDITLLPSDMKVTDIILSDTINSERVIGTIQSSELKLTNGFISRSKLIGILPTYVQPIEDPTRYARTGIAVCGRNLTLNNKWRQYA